jgi:hypothetical protein
VFERTNTEEIESLIKSALEARVRPLELRIEKLERQLKALRRHLERPDDPDKRAPVP